MFNLSFNKQGGFCDKVSRRNVLTLGATGLLGGLSLPSMLQMQAVAASAKPARVKSCIFLMLEGGPSHIDMWDLKPNAPTEIRGPFNPISTNVPGTQISEILPMCSKIADKFTILRSHSHGDNAHQTGRHWVMTGYKPNFPDGQAKGIPFNEHYPSIGSMVSRELGHRGAVPPYIEVPEPLGPGGPGFYGPRYAPFTIETDPVEPTFSVRDLNIVDGIDENRFARRRTLLERANALGAGGGGVGRAKTMGTYYEKALEMVTSPAARRAFNIQGEKDAVRERYGMTSIGQCSLLARRLVEAEVPFVNVSWSEYVESYSPNTDFGWDTHVNNFDLLPNRHCPILDRALSALLDDMDARGLLDSTLVVCMGEFGRTPRINKRASRDHWAHNYFSLWAGAGVKPGRVIGASDAKAEKPVTRPIEPTGVGVTMLDCLGIDSIERAKLNVLPEGEFIHELF